MRNDELAVFLWITRGTLECIRQRVVNIYRDNVCRGKGIDPSLWSGELINICPTIIDVYGPLADYNDITNEYMMRSIPWILFNFVLLKSNEILDV